MTVSTGLSSLLIAEKLSLVPINLNDPNQHAEFKQQRVICGWDYDDEALQMFIEKQEKKVKSMFWITIPQRVETNGKLENRDDLPETNTVAPDTNGHAAGGASPSATLFTIRAGHISLDSYAEPADPELALEDRSILTVQTFFILPEYRTGGIGRAAMDLVEDLATQEPYGSPRCHTLALTTVSKKHIEIDDPEWRGIWKRCGLDVPPFSNETWYEKLGYFYWKEEPRYKVQALDGSPVHIIASFMRKKLR
jgi:GNAT superfamily N-acetyltransferase